MDLGSYSDSFQEDCLVNTDVTQPKILPTLFETSKSEVDVESKKEHLSQLGSESDKKMAKTKPKVPKTSEAQKMQKGKKVKSYMNSEKFEIVKYILSKFQEYYISHQLSLKKTQGRPRNIKTEEEKEGFIAAWTNNFCDELSKLKTKKEEEKNSESSKDRTDALFTFIIRKLRSIPLLLQKFTCCKSGYKSESLKETLDSYLECFFMGFIVYFEIPLGGVSPSSIEESDLLKLFFDFIILKFPEDRVTLLINMYNEDASRPFNYVSSIASAFKLVKATSVKLTKKLYIANSAFKQICMNYNIFSKIIPQKYQTMINSVVSKII